MGLSREFFAWAAYRLTMGNREGLIIFIQRYFDRTAISLCVRGYLAYGLNCVFPNA